MPAAVTNTTISGNYLHVSAGAAGCAVYQIPGIVPTQYGLTGACGGPVTWTLNPAGVGTLNASGLYTAPATGTANQTVTVTATGANDPSQTASAPVTLSQILTLNLTSSVPSPYITGAPASYAVYQPTTLVYTDPYGRVYTVDGSGNRPRARYRRRDCTPRRQLCPPQPPSA